MSVRYRQQGMTAIGWLLTLAFLALVAIILMKVVPIYIQGYKVGASLESLKEEVGLGAKGPGQITSLLMKRLDINMVDEVGPEHIIVSREQNGVSVQAVYEIRRHIMGNLDVVVSFDQRVWVPGN